MNKKIPVIISLFLIVLTITSLYFKDDITAVLKNHEYKASLSAERQEIYDKMQIEYVNIKNRLTGTAPWNTGSVSNTEGIDVSESDDYVRTFDVVKYTLELGITPNTSIDGVTDASTFNGGVIKVRAKLPNQNELILMTWEQDAWMQNVTYNADKTEIYAEYHVPSGVSVTNANQNLTFTIKIGGYKKEVTADMAPEFEIWMEGNQPDNATSSAESLTVKENKNLIISGHPSYDFELTVGPYLNQPGEKDGVKGNYYNFNVSFRMKQDVSGFSDLRGVEYPTKKVEAVLDFDYYYTKVGANEGSKLITADTTNANGLANGTKIIAYGINADYSPAYYPKSSGELQNQGLPIGGKKYTSSGSYDKSVEDSGNVTMTINDDKIYVSFEDFKVSGHFPIYNWWSDRVSIQYNNTTGYIAVGNFEFFTPYYDCENASYDYSYNIKLDNWTYNTLTTSDNKVTKEDNSNLDTVPGNNSIAISGTSRLLGSMTSETRASASQTPWYAGITSVMLGNEFDVFFGGRMKDGPYEGGTDHLLVWDSEVVTFVQYQTQSQSSVVGFPTYDWNLVKKYGVYKANPNLGVTGLSLVNSTAHEDFDWYATPEEALANGKIAAMLVEDPDNIGMQISRNFYVRFRMTDDRNKVGTTAVFRHKFRAYGDKEKTQIYYYAGKNSFTSATSFTPTKYDINGAVNSYQSPHEIGETVLILGLKTEVSLTVTDTNSSGAKKQSYDVGDGEINFKINPSLINGGTASSSDPTTDSVLVTTYLPVGLSYKNGSANKEPKSVTINSDGTTTIVWEYKNWQVNHAAPDYSEITFTAEISASLENNSSLEIRSTIFNNQDLRSESIYRTSKYGVIISNLAGSKAIKAVDKPLVDTNESFSVTSTIGNTSQESLKNVKSIEILPTNGDANGSKFSGTYTTKVTSLAKGQKLYYTTKSISVIGLTEDKYGKLTIKEVDLENDDRWTEAKVGDTIPSTATAIATYMEEITPYANENYVLEIIPTNNKQRDVYAFTMNVTSDNLAQAVKSNIVISKVVERNLEGFAFIDVNRNNIYDNGDTLLTNNVVKLLDGNGTQVATTQTDSTGKYIFVNVAKGNYYVEFSIPNNYELISKNGGEASVSSSVNSNNRTDLITGQNATPTKETILVSNLNLGVRKIDATLTVHHYIDGTTTKLADDQTSTVYYGDTYTTAIHKDIPDNYELKSKSDNFTGIVSSKSIEVIYYYQKKDSTLETTISKNGPEEITKKDEVVEYKITYTAKATDYIGNGTITIVDTLPHKIDLEKSNIAEGTYDEETNTITWTIQWNDIDSFNNKGEITIEKNISLVYSDILPTERNMINSVKGSIELDNNSRETESQTSTDIKIPGTIIVHHYIKDTEVSLSDSVTSTDLVGESYTSTALDIEGYIITKPETEEYTYTEEEQVVIYYYEKIKVKVNTQVDGIGGTIVGDEDVDYGDDSTKDNIVIKPDDGYVLGEVIINGEKIELTEEDKNGLVLENFHEMKEDMNIVVKFEKVVEEENPNTGAFISLLVIIAIPISLGILTYLKKHKKLKKI